MYKAVILAIISQMEFNKNDFKIYTQDLVDVIGSGSTQMVKA